MYMYRHNILQYTQLKTYCVYFSSICLFSNVNILFANLRHCTIATDRTMPNNDTKDSMGCTAKQLIWKHTFVIRL